MGKVLNKWSIFTFDLNHVGKVLDCSCSKLLLKFCFNISICSLHYKQYTVVGNGDNGNQHCKCDTLSIRWKTYSRYDLTSSWQLLRMYHCKALDWVVRNFNCEVPKQRNLALNKAKLEDSLHITSMFLSGLVNFVSRPFTYKDKKVNASSRT